MYTLLGLIQMLMITQSRFMPDLDVLFRPAPVRTEMVSHFPAGTQEAKKSVTVYSADLVTVRRKRYTEKCIPPVRRNMIARKLSINRSFSRTRATTGNKLYLVFCQWKTEG